MEVGEGVPYVLAVRLHTGLGGTSSLLRCLMGRLAGWVEVTLTTSSSALKAHSCLPGALLQMRESQEEQSAEVLVQQVPLLSGRSLGDHGLQKQTGSTLTTDVCRNYGRCRCAEPGLLCGFFPWLELMRESSSPVD